MANNSTGLVHILLHLCVPFVIVFPFHICVSPKACDLLLSGFIYLVLLFVYVFFHSLPVANMLTVINIYHNALFYLILYFVLWVFLCINF